MPEITSERTGRQKIIDGWDQDAIDRLNISIIGSSALTNYLLVYLSGLFQKTKGNIRLIDNSRLDKKLKGEFLINGLIHKYPPGESKVYCLAHAINKIHPGFHVRAYHTFYDPVFLDGTEIIVDLSNEPYTKSKSFNYSMENDKVWIGAVSDQTRGGLLIKDKGKNIEPLLFEKFKDKYQGSITSGLISGVIAEEIRKQAFKFNSRDKTLEGLLCYNLNSKNRFSSKDDIPERFESFINKKILVIGCGGIGNYIGLGLALLGVGNIDLVDDDTIQESDLNRQFLFYDGEGKKKTDVLEKKLKQINPLIKIKPIFGRVDDKSAKKGKTIDKDYISKNKYDLILSCVDNEKTRYILNDIALDLSLPLIDGGVRYNSGTVRVVVPGKTACLDELMGVRYEEGKEHSCRFQRPSVVYTNSIIAFAMLGEARNVLFPKTYGKSIKNVIRYSSFEKRKDLRLMLKEGQKLPKEGCKCHRIYVGGQK